MNLAKIRQKAKAPGQSLQIPVAEPGAPKSPALPGAPEPMEPIREERPVPAEPAAPVSAKAPVPHQAPPVWRSPGLDPYARILEGRHAAGLTDQPDQPEAQEAASDDYLEFLCIRVSDETYGINIMEIKEIIKPREVTEVPRAPDFVSGVISLRGIILPVLDMLKRLGLEREAVTGKERVVVVRHGDSYSGLLVDEVIQVVRIAKDALEPAPAVLDGIVRDFVSGIGRSENRMIILLNLESIANINLL